LPSSPSRFRSSPWSCAATASRGRAINPLPWSIFAGFLVSAWQIELPAPLLRPVAMLAEAVSPVALFTLGAVLARSRMAALVATPAPAGAAPPPCATT
jgi:predicted permease